jgi:hypothetical protein
MMKKFAAVAAVTGVLVLGGAGVAAADQEPNAATGSSNGSVLSGNNVQAPVNVPVNACGNTVSVLGSLNPAGGNSCVSNN